MSLAQSARLLKATDHSTQENDNMASAPALELASETPGTDIALAVNADPGIVLLDSEKFDAFYAKMKAETDKLVPDVSTAKGRDEIRSMAARVTRSKTAIDKARLGLTAEWRENVKKANEAGKLIEERLQSLADEVRQPLTEWEETEKARIATIDGMIAELKAHARVDSLDSAGMVRERGTQVWGLSFDPEVYQDRLDETEQVKSETVATLRAALVRMEREEADRAELERLRAEAAEREEADRLAREEVERVAAAQEAACREAEEAAAYEERRAAAEQAAQEEIEREKREAAERATREAEEAAQAERDRIEREHADALAAERARAEQAERAAREQQEAADRQRAEEAAAAKKLAEEQAAREANVKHRTAVKTKAKQAIMTCGCSEDAAQKIVLAIIAREIPGVTLEF